jgi:fatty-acyl-CoA synthase
MSSYARGADAPLIEKTIDGVLRDTAARWPDRDALVVRRPRRVVLTWSQLDAAVERTARGLAGLGLKPGDRAGAWSSNCLEWILLQMACARSGVVMVNVNPAYRSHELEYVLRESRMRALFLHERDERADYAAVFEQARNGHSIVLEHAVWLGGRARREPSLPGEIAWEEMLERGALYQTGHSHHDIANIQYTSGTTGAPKGVLLTHRNLVNNGRGIAWGLNYSERDRICSPVPLYHCFGCVIGVMCALVSGACFVVPSPSFDALATMEAVHEERATSLYGVPTMFIAELNHSEFHRFDFSSLRTGVMAGSPCPIEIMRRVASEMHCPELCICYGQTEASPVISMSKVDDPLETRVTTVGHPCPNTEVKIVGEDGVTVAHGETGELCARGYLVMAGYDHDPEATAEAVDSEGWLHTGDLAAMRPDGYVHITGRATDMIIRGGENIYPREVEEFLYGHPKIADVQVVGVPDARLGETVAAWIRLKPGLEATDREIQDFCRGKIAYFKTPALIRFVDQFPATTNGKIQKFKIRELEIEWRGLEGVASQATA